MSPLRKILSIFVQSLMGVSLAPIAQDANATPGSKPAAPALGGRPVGQDWPTQPAAPAGAPNVVVVLLDDVGFGATSTFGGPAQTPVLDKLAAEGLRYNQFHTTALSSPTRASLLTGRNHHQVGFGTITEAAQGYPGYNSVWPKSAASIPDILRRHGYSTAGFGKWHNTPTWESGPAGPFDHWPSGLGFEYYYGFQGGETSQWQPALFRNTTLLAPPATPEQGYHLTSDITDDAIGWLHTHQAVAPDKPYFLYYATGAAHAPHHVPAEWIAKYRGKFDQGWDKLREEIFARQKAAGIVPLNAELTARPTELPAWDSLSAEQKRLVAHQAEVFAAFLEHTDHEIGRLIEAVRAGPHGDNTLIMFVVGDNGGSPEGGLNGSDINIAASFLGIPNPVPEQLQHLDELGSERWDNHFATPWAWATDTPFQWTKQVASHFGGTRNGLVVSWPARLQGHGEVRSQFGHVNDIAPTIYEATGIRLPDTVDGVRQLPLEGKSLIPSFADAHAPERHRLQYFEMLGNRAIYKDGWVAAARHGLPWELNNRGEDFAADRWELYHVAEDFSQAHDLAVQNPQKLAELKREFEREATRNQVFPLHNSLALKSLLGGKPAPNGTRREFTYHPDQAQLPSNSVPTLLRPYRFTAQLDVPASGAEGVIVAQGGRLGGYSLYVRNGHLVFANNFFGKLRDTLRSPDVLPSGAIEVGVEYLPRSSQPWTGGNAKLLVNGRVVAEGPLTRVGLPELSETFDVGRDRGSPVSAEYQAPFAFSGQIRQVHLLLQ